MSRLDSPVSVVLMFVAAAAVSALLILLLNAEARSRKSHREPEIRNGNIFSELGGKLKSWMTLWFTDTNSTTTEVLVIDTSGDWETGGAVGSRRLQWARDMTQSEDQHRIRHGPKHPRGAAASRHAAHACYDTNEVLVIIGLTCVVNLAFVAAVLCLVHMCGRHRPSWSDAATLIADGGDVPLLIPTEESTTSCCPISPYSGVQGYASSFTDGASQHKYGDHRASSRSMEHLLFIG